MTLEACKAWVDANVARLQNEYGIGYFSLTIEYRRLDGDGQDDWRSVARVSVMPEYERAKIMLDYEVIGDEAELESHFRHELCHLVHSPVELMVKTIEPFLVSHGDHVAASVTEAYRICQEQLVRNIERLLAGHKEAAEQAGKEDSHVGE